MNNNKVLIGDVFCWKATSECYRIVKCDDSGVSGIGEWLPPSWTAKQNWIRAAILSSSWVLVKRNGKTICCNCYEK